MDSTNRKQTCVKDYGGYLPHHSWWEIYPLIEIDILEDPHLSNDQHNTSNKKGTIGQSSVNEYCFYIEFSFQFYLPPWIPIEIRRGKSFSVSIHSEKSP
jgi:hypothetical protein